MSPPKKIAVLVGSLRRGSYNRMMSHALMEATPASLEFETLEIGGLPMYNADLENDLPDAYVEFRRKLREFDGVLFVTPEYNRGLPAVLKNAIDVGSRPSTENAWAGKPAAIVTVSTDAIGGFGANHQLRQSLVFINVIAMLQPEAYIGNAKTLFDESGALVNDSTHDFIAGFMNRFAAWVELHPGGAAV